MIDILQRRIFLEKKGPFDFLEGAVDSSKNHLKKSNDLFAREKNHQNHTNSDAQKICEESISTMTVCDIVEGWKGDQIYPEKVSKIKPE